MLGEGGFALGSSVRQSTSDGSTTETTKSTGDQKQGTRIVINKDKLVSLTATTAITAAVSAVVARRLQGGD